MPSMPDFHAQQLHAYPVGCHYVCKHRWSGCTPTEAIFCDEDLSCQPGESGYTCGEKSFSHKLLSVFVRSGKVGTRREGVGKLTGSRSDHSLETRCSNYCPGCGKGSVEATQVVLQWRSMAEQYFRVSRWYFDGCDDVVQAYCLASLV